MYCTPPSHHVPVHKSPSLTSQSYHGIATHYIHSTSLPSLSARLAELHFKDFASLPERQALIASTIEEFTTGLPSPRPQIHGRLRQHIDICFESSDPLQILSRLAEVQSNQEEDASIREWADKTIKTIRERSPIAVAVTAQQMRVAKDWNIAETFQREHDIATAFMHHPDFVEGVTARLIERKKTRPDWQPNTLEDVTSEEVDRFFQKGKDVLPLLESGAEARYSEYPHKKLALPTEQEILNVYDGGNVQAEEVVQHFLTERGGKVGIREKVGEVLERQ
jgi:3-hydroxyisobutyryl-CoA hydrolase